MACSGGVYGGPPKQRDHLRSPKGAEAEPEKVAGAADMKQPMAASQTAVVEGGKMARPLGTKTGGKHPILSGRQPLWRVETPRKEETTRAAPAGCAGGAEAEEERGVRRAEEGTNMEQVVNVEVEDKGKITMMELLKAIELTCGRVLGCRAKGMRKWEITMANVRGKEKLLDGFKIRSAAVWAAEVVKDQRVVSFLNLPLYIPDDMIRAKLQMWGVELVSPIKRKKWPGTDIYDGTRFMKVRFTEEVSSLPYSTKFETLEGVEYFRVIHDNQEKVCRLCIQPGHILRDCPEFKCFKCGKVGHYARECAAESNRCADCRKPAAACTCVEDAERQEEEEEADYDTAQPEDGDTGGSEMEEEEDGHGDGEEEEEEGAESSAVPETQQSAQKPAAAPEPIPTGPEIREAAAAGGREESSQQSGVGLSRKAIKKERQRRERAAQNVGLLPGWQHSQDARLTRAAAAAGLRKDSNEQREDSTGSDFSERMGRGGKKSEEEARRSRSRLRKNE